jgi:AraC-like DNA-binding protein
MAVGRLFRIEDWEKLAREARFQPATMADLCFISLRQMERFFAQQFNVSPRLWARELRCRKARELIAQGWSSKAVVAELGFVDGSHFGREFRKFYGASPQTFAPLYGSNSSSRTNRAVTAARSNGVGTAVSVLSAPPSHPSPQRHRPAGMSRRYPDVVFLPSIGLVAILWSR